MSLQPQRSVTRFRKPGSPLAWVLIAFVLLLVLATLIVRISRAPLAWRGSGAVTVTPIAIPPPNSMPQLGPFVLTGAWMVKSGHPRFGGYSALLPRGQALFAINDRGYTLTFTPGRQVTGGVIERSVPYEIYPKTSLDSEAATLDPITGQMWLAWEGANAITRHDPGSVMPRLIYPEAMAGWPRQRGAEAMVRLTNGRFIVLREGFGSPDDTGIFGEHRHEGLLFADDPVSGARPFRFSFVGPAGFSPVDMAELPDRRVLILMRKLVWPFPPKFAGRILIADPAEIGKGREWHARIVARLPSTFPIDNFEGMAIVPGARGDISVWLISDDNRVLTQRTLLWHLAANSAALTRLPSHDPVE